MWYMIRNLRCSVSIDSFWQIPRHRTFSYSLERHFSSRLPPSGGTWKFANAPSKKKKTWRDSLPIDMLLSAVSVLVVAQSSSEIPEGLTNNPVHYYNMSDTSDVCYAAISHPQITQKIINHYTNQLMHSLV